MRSLNAFLTATMLLLPLTLRAEEPQFAVRVRTVRTLDHVTREEAHGARHMDGKLHDISSKLLKLPYRSFQLLSTQKADIKLMTKETLSLPDDRKVTIRPLKMDEDRICMWIKWVDADGSTIIDSRMHFNTGEAMISGSEQSDEEGLVLAIEVMPK